MTHLLNDARNRLPDMIEDALRLIACESPSDDLDAITHSADVTTAVLTARLTEAGLPNEPERIMIDGVTHLRWSTGEPTRVLLLGHHDTVWPHGSLDTHPAQVQDGVLTGPGCYDMKVGTVQAIHAVASLATAHGPAAVAGVTILITGDEEVGSQSSRTLLEQEARAADAVLVLEASGPGGALKTERKGVSLYSLTVHGRAAHAGLDPERGVNAGLELAHQLPAIAALADGTTTVTPTSGTIGTVVNTVPAKARIDVDVRAATATEQQRVDEQIRALTPVLDGARLSVDGQINRPPLERSLASDLFARASALAADAGIEGLTECSVGGASDGNFTAGLGTPTLDGLGGVGGGAHAADEHVETVHIPHRTALLALLVQDLLAHPLGHPQ